MADKFCRSFHEKKIVKERVLINYHELIFKRTVPILLIISVLFCLSTASATDNSTFEEADSGSTMGSIPYDTNNIKSVETDNKPLSKVYVSNSGNDSNTGSQNSPKASIKDALNTVSDGGTIYLSSGTYNESKILINKNVAIVGEATKTTILNSKKEQTFIINSTTKLKALTITNAQTKDSGAAIYNTGNLKLEGIKIQTSYARYLGGGVYNDGILYAVKCSFSSNNAKNGGSIFNNNTLTVSRCSFTGNKAKTVASAIYSNKYTRIYGTSFTNNHNTTLCANRGAVIILESSTFTNNSGVNGGSLYNRQSYATINKTLFDNNMAYTAGGAVYSTGETNVTNSTFTNNTSGNGGAIMSYIRLYVDSSSFRSNHADNYGGAVHSTGNSIFTGSKFRNNTGSYGGALSSSNKNNAKTVIDTSEFLSNTALRGAGAYVYGNNSLNIQYSIFNHNNANALFVKSTRTDNRVYNSSFYGNGAVKGGAVHSDGSTMKLEKLFLSSNNASMGGALYNYKAYTVLNNSVIINNAVVDSYNNMGRIEQDNNWWGVNNRPGSDRTNSPTDKWIVMSLDSDASPVNHNTSISVSLNNLYDGKSIESYPSDRYLPFVKVELDVSGQGYDDNTTTYSGGLYAKTYNFTQAGPVNITARISGQVLKDSLVIRDISANRKIVGMYVQIDASVTSSDVKKWVSAGITDVFVQSRASTNNTRQLEKVIDLCRNSGIRVHAWVICFSTSNGFDISSSQQNMIKNFVRSVIRINGVCGVSLDYVRYSGTNPGIVDPDRITDFVRQVHSIVKGYDENLIVSASVFAEKAGTRTYYGQDYAALSPYLDIIMPMAYKYDYTPTRAWLKDVTDYVVDRAVYSSVVTVLQTYKEVGSGVSVLSTSEIEGDARAVMDAGSYGYCLFRYGLLNSYPSVDL